MKRYTIVIAVALCALMTVSCKNNKESKEETQVSQKELMNAAKDVLTNDVLQMVDELAQKYMELSKTSALSYSTIANMTAEEKLLKPDYLLDPKKAVDFLTKTQKVNALAVLMTERSIRRIYDMPLADTDRAIAKLISDLNLPVDLDELSTLPLSKKIEQTYNWCKEHGEVDYFWQFQIACQNSELYLIAKNANIFFRNVSDEAFNDFFERVAACHECMKKLAPYDAGIAKLYRIETNNPLVASGEDVMEKLGTKEAAKETLSKNVNVLAARRAAMLQ